MSETAETRVVAVLNDMFFTSKIKEAAKSTGVNVEILKKISGLIEGLRNDPPTLIIVDLNFRKVEPIELIKEIKSSDKLNSIPVIGYFSHVQEDLKKEAIKAGFDVVMPRSRFVRELRDILVEHSSKVPQI
jgi:PleD family two-component response regulator